MALTVEVDGTRYNQAISMSVKRSIENATGSFISPHHRKRTT